MVDAGASSRTHGVLATYPSRAGTLRAAVDSIAGQLDHLTLVLNEYDHVPGWVAGNVSAVIPDADTKDTGKYLVPGEDGWLFTLDDDIVYPPDYVACSLAGMRLAAERLGNTRIMAGYLGWTYRRARILPWRWARRLTGFRLDYIVNSTDGADFREGFARAQIVEALGTGVAIMRSEDAPPFEYVRDAQRFIDVRLASWCLAKGITQVCLPRREGWLHDAHEGVQEESIFESFTKHPSAELVAEAWRVAFRAPRRGETLDFGFDDMIAAAGRKTGHAEGLVSWCN